MMLGCQTHLMVELWNIFVMLLRHFGGHVVLLRFKALRVLYLFNKIAKKSTRHERVDVLAYTVKKDSSYVDVWEDRFGQQNLVSRNFTNHMLFRIANKLEANCGRF
jgi:hypothetical protein